MKDATKWVLLGGAILLVLTGVGYALRPLNMFVDRQVMVNSHQYQEGRAERLSLLEANLAEVEALLRNEKDQTVRGNLEAQKSALNAQIKAARR